MGMRPLSEAFPITQRFYQNLTAFNTSGNHAAVDIGAPIGSPVVAPEDGVITFADWAWALPGGPNDWAARKFQIKPAVGVTNVGGGIMTFLENSAGSTWIIAHLNSNDIAPAGTRVRKGQIIGYSGNTGSSTGPHAHIALIPKNPDYGNGFWGGIDPEPHIREKYAPLTPTDDRKTTNEGYLNGIDVSAYQPHDIASKVSADFVIVKVTEGIGWESKIWRAQLADARKRKRKVGVYHYCRPQNDPVAEANYFYDTAKSADSPDLVWVADWEEPAYYANTAWASRFMARLDQLTGKTTVLYANTAGLIGGTWSSKDRDRPVWRAFPVLKGTGYATSFDLPPLPSGWTRLVMDQYSFHGRLAGYGADLDLNVYYGGLTPWGAVGSASTKKDFLAMATEADLRRIVREESKAAIIRELTYYRNKRGGAGGKVSIQDQILWMAADAKKVNDKLDAIMAAVTPSVITACIREAGLSSDVDEEKLAGLIAGQLITKLTNVRETV